MSSLNDCIKFQLDIKDLNIIFSAYFKKNTNSKFHKVYMTDLFNRFILFCLSSNLKHNGQYTSNVRFITADASHPVIIRLKKECLLCNAYLKRSMA